MITPNSPEESDVQPVSNAATFALLAAGCVALGGLIFLACRFL